MTLTDKLNLLKSGFARISCKVYHYWRPKMAPPFAVWQEDGGASLLADSHAAEQSLSGTLDFYSKLEADPLLDEIQTVLNDLSLIWELNSVQYEENTGLIHYEWIWSVM